MTYSHLPLRWKIISVALLFGIVTAVTSITSAVVSQFPTWLIYYILTAMVAWAIGAMMGERSARKVFERERDAHTLPSDV